MSTFADYRHDVASAFEGRTPAEALKILGGVYSYLWGDPPRVFWGRVGKLLKAHPAVEIAKLMFLAGARDLEGDPVTYITAAFYRAGKDRSYAGLILEGTIEEQVRKARELMG